MTKFEDDVSRVVRNVRSGDRTKAQLKACGCDVCKEALKRLDKRRKTHIK